MTTYQGREDVEAAIRKDDGTLEGGKELIGNDTAGSNWAAGRGG